MARKPEPKDDELGRRLAAARAYKRWHQVPTAKKLDVDAATLGGYENEGVAESSAAIIRERAPAAFEMPKEFFVIPFDELPQMAEAWDHVQRLADPRDLGKIVDDAPDSKPRP